MRILWHGVKSIIKTGYGNQTRLMLPRIRDLGHEVAINAIIDQYQTGIDENGIVNFACGPNSQMMGNDFLDGHVERFNPDIVISMCDPFVCKPEKFEKVNWYPFVMVDSEPLLWENAEVLKACKRPIAPTRHAEKMLKDAGFDPYYVPLAVDMDVFKPMDREQARADMGKVWGVNLAGRYVVVMNSANHSTPSRKNFAAAFKAFAMFEKDHPEALLYVHADISGKVYPGEDLLKIADLYGIKSLAFAPQYEYNCGMIGDDYMVKMYNAADVFLHSARGEGFGLPIVEAQACGTTVVVPNFGSMAELCTDDGYAASGQKWMYHSGTEQFLVDYDVLCDCLSWAFGKKPIRADHRKVQPYHVATVIDTFEDVLIDIEKELADAA